MRLNKRLADLEARIDPLAPVRWVRVFQYEDQTQEQAVAAWEAENGPVGERNVVLRVIVSKPGPAPVHV